jgi:chromosome segregation ATPase
VYVPSKNPLRLLTQYNNSIDELKIQLEMKTKELENLSSLLGSYEKNDTIYLSTTDSLSKIDGNSSATYDALVQKQKAVADEITDIDSKIRRYQIKIENLTGNAVEDSENIDEASSESSSASSSKSSSKSSLKSSTSKASSETSSQASSSKKREKNAAQTATVEAEIANLETQVDVIWGQFAAMLEAYTDQELNEQTLKDSKLRYDTPSLLSGAFIKKAIKTAGPFVAIGFIICMLMLLRVVIREEKERNRLTEDNM